MKYAFVIEKAANNFPPLCLIFPVAWQQAKRSQQSRLKSVLRFDSISMACRRMAAGLQINPFLIKLLPCMAPTTATRQTTGELPTQWWLHQRTRSACLMFCRGQAC